MFSPICSHPASKLRDERGFGLIEVIVSTLMLVLISLGIYIGIDGASANSGINKNRSIGSELAQQDQDRMRAMAVDELSNYRLTYAQTVNGVTYTTTSAASWVTDSTGTASCTNPTAQANYLRISSSVTWPSMRIQPVTVESVIAPPSGSFGTDQGSLAVQVRDRNGNGVPGVSVALTGTRAYTDVTNASGCVLWGYLPAGANKDYTVAITKNGYVDPAGNPAPSQQTGVVGAAVTPLTFDYDVGGRILAQYETLNTSGAPIAANGMSFMASNSNLQVAVGPFGDGASHASFTTGLMYPFNIGYGVYAGSCSAAAPATPPTAIVVPGGVTTVTLREPPINVKVVNGASLVNGASVTLTGPCGKLPARTTGVTGLLTDPAFPYGTYSFCVQNGTQIKKVTNNSPALSTFANTTANGVPTTSATVDMSSGTSTGPCP